MDHKSLKNILYAAFINFFYITTEKPDVWVRGTWHFEGPGLAEYADDAHKSHDVWRCLQWDES